MGKQKAFVGELKPLLDDREKLERFIVSHSNLPGPRGNLELAFAVAEIYDDVAVLQDWIAITEDQAGVNNPKSFLAFCAAVCLGSVYVKTKNKEIISLLKNSANDGRWRMREAVAFGFQIIGMHDFDELKRIFSEWIARSNNLEKRAILVSLAHPPMLHEQNAEYCFDLTDRILQQMDQEHGFEVLRKGLEFTISVFVAANQLLGFSFIKRWIGKDKIIDRILKENLKKNRLVRIDPEMVQNLLTQLG